MAAAVAPQLPSPFCSAMNQHGSGGRFPDHPIADNIFASLTLVSMGQSSTANSNVQQMSSEQNVDNFLPFGSDGDWPVLVGAGLHRLCNNLPPITQTQVQKPSSLNQAVEVSAAGFTHLAQNLGHNSGNSHSNLLKPPEALQPLSPAGIDRSILPSILSPWSAHFTGQPSQPAPVQPQSQPLHLHNSIHLASSQNVYSPSHRSAGASSIPPLQAGQQTATSPSLSQQTNQNLLVLDNNKTPQGLNLNAAIASAYFSAFNQVNPVGTMHGLQQNQLYLQTQSRQPPSNLRHNPHSEGNSGAGGQTTPSMMSLNPIVLLPAIQIGAKQSSNAGQGPSWNLEEDTAHYLFQDKAQQSIGAQISKRPQAFTDFLTSSPRAQGYLGANLKESDASIEMFTFATNKLIAPSNSNMNFDQPSRAVLGYSSGIPAMASQLQPTVLMTVQDFPHNLSLGLDRVSSNMSSSSAESHIWDPCKRQRTDDDLALASHTRESTVGGTTFMKLLQELEDDKILVRHFGDVLGVRGVIGWTVEEEKMAEWKQRRKNWFMDGKEGKQYKPNSFYQVLRRLGYFPTQRTKRASHGYDFEGSYTFVLDQSKRYTQHSKTATAGKSSGSSDSIAGPASGEGLGDK